MIDYEKFQKSLKHLEVQYANYTGMDDRPNLTEIDKEAITESVIQRFEICYDSLWKVLKRYLNETLGIPDVPNSPKPVFRLANENSLFTSPVDKWLLYADTRVDTAHDYSLEKVEQALSMMKDFIGDAIGLYQTMTGLTWE
ncbi:MAG: nucleotidyltransferase [Brevinematales bacterium]|nr:nucleotidyltransferase [Brevinematales bacterium]